MDLGHRSSSYFRRAGHRECHIGGDFLLAHKIDDGGKVGQVVFVRAGTHAELFSE